MNSMLSAIRQRRGGAPGKEEMNEPAAEMSEGGAAPDLEALVASLSAEQKQALLGMLMESAEESSEGIVKGAPGSGEKAEVAERAGSELSDDESDDIAMSMTDKGALTRSERGAKPLGLGDRAKMYMAQNLKNKGKM